MAWTVEAAKSAKRLEWGRGRKQESRMIPRFLNGNLDKTVLVEVSLENRKCSFIGREEKYEALLRACLYANPLKY